MLASTAGTNLQVSERPDADHDFLRIARRSTASTDGRRGRHVVDGYTGTMENAAFGTGFEVHTDWQADSGDTLSNTASIWSGFQGSWTGGRPTGRATWVGLMFGYQGDHQPHENPFVEGTARAVYSLSDQTLDVAFSDIASRDGERRHANFGFSDVPVSRYGTFLGGGTAGILSGAFFGSSHAEVAGSFHHNPARVTGSFGATRELGTTVAAQRRTEDAIPDATNDVVFHALDGWGPWETEPGEDGIHALIPSGAGEPDQADLPGTASGQAQAAPTGSNPVSGSAVWSGSARATDTRPEADGTTVHGSARLEVDFGDATVDIDLTSFGADHEDMSWQALPMVDGTFRDSGDVASIDGAFYGSDHQSAAGSFDRNHLQGEFEATRD